METIDLCGQWQVRQDRMARQIPATVPGCIHTDLLAAGEIEDPFYRDREIDVQWIGTSTWTYSRGFDVPESFLRYDKVLLRCEGLDTVATVTLNGKKIAQTENQFRTWEFDVRDALKAGTNELVVRFDSPLPLQLERMTRPALRGPSHVSYEMPGRTMIRKSQCNYGWDWGPALVTCGIWRPISLVGFDVARISEVAFRQTHHKKSVDLEVAVAAETVTRAKLKAAVTVTLDGKPVATEEIALRAGKGKITLAIKNPRLWWPAGMGEQPLYAVTVDLLDETGGLLDTDAKRVGLRTLELDRHKDQWGESFQFVANGVPFFAKGANWIPADQFPTRVTADDYRRLLTDAAAANMNMLRVWGGGIYEPDVFYDLCDELGLCVWQDFMFACAAYPTYDEAFMENFRVEAEDNVRRIRHHASLALWCGNNELEQINVRDEWNDQYKHMPWDEYKKLFDKLLPKVLRKLDPDTDYWPSSPHSPRGDRGDFNNPTCGDAHLWSVWHGRQPFEWYRTCEHRFNSEFGFQSFPEPKTVNDYTLPEDRNVTSPIMEHHQRSGVGNSVIMHYMLDWFRLPTDFDMLLWLSQIQHGMAMKYAVEHWRRSMPRGMGTLYWQINDCWPVASWASIDYHGRWKALQYMARHFFAPVLVSGVEDIEAGTVEVHVTSDKLRPIPGKLAWELTDTQGETVDAGSAAVNVPACKSRRVKTLRLAKHIKARGERNLLLWLTLTDRRGEVLSRNLVTFARPKQMSLPEPKVKVAVKRRSATEFVLTLTSDKPALWAWVQLAEVEARFSDNFVHLAAGEPIEITMITEEGMSLTEAKRRLTVSSLVDTYR